MLDSGLVTAFSWHPVAVYLKYRLVFFLILFDQRASLVVAVQLSSISRLANNARLKVQEVLTALQFDENSGENELSSNQECVRYTKSLIESKILFKNISEIRILIYFGRQR